jgi:flavin-dependent dehydrogenase
MGGSVGPKSGPTFLVIGDAAGSVNPFNGEGIDYAYETGRIAAEVLSQAITENDPNAISLYTKRIDDEFGQYFKVARLFSHIIGRPLLMRELSRVGMQSRTLMEWVLRIMANLLREDELGVAEVAYKAAVQIARAAPNA